MKFSPEDIAYAKALYIFGSESEKGFRVFPTLRKVAKLTKVSYSILAKFSTDEDWPQQRYTTYKEFYDRIKEDRLSKMVERSLRLREALFNGAQFGIGLIAARLNAIGEAHKESPKAIKGYEVRDLAMAMETFKRVGMESVGDRATDEVSWKDIAQIAKGTRYGVRSHGPRKPRHRSEAFETAEGRKAISR